MFVERWRVDAGATAILLTAALFLTAGRALGADSDSPTERDGVNPLVAKQKMIRDRIARLEDRMFRLRATLADQEPENAARLESALKRVGELGVAERVDAIVALLSGQSRLEEASESQLGLMEDLETVLDALTFKARDKEEREEEIARLEELKARLNELADKQRGLRRETSQSIRDARRAGQLGDAIRRLDALIERQSGALESSQSGGPSPGGAEAAGEQERIQRDTERLAEELKGMGDAGEETEGRPSAPSGGEPSASQPPGSESGQSAPKTGQAARELRSAADDMSGAANALKDEAADVAADEQEEALEKLGRARHRLQEAKEELEAEGGERKLAEGQRKAAEQAQNLRDQMGGASGQQEQGGQQGQQGGQSGQQAPGQQQVEQAQQHMEEAAESLEAEQPREATGEQDAALGELEDAIAELEEALRQLRQEEQEEILRDLEGRFRALLTGQLDINAGTRELDAIGLGAFERAERLRAAELSQGQLKLSKDASTCLHVLEEEGTTVVFPAVLEQIADDMKTVSDRLGELKVGPLTQQIEDDIVTVLKDLVEAIERKQEQLEQQQSPMDTVASDSEQPLLPTSAELKLLKSMQVRIHERTGAVEAERAAEIEDPADLDAMTETIAERQHEAAKIATEMRELEAVP